MHKNYFPHHIVALGAAFFFFKMAWSLVAYKSIKLILNTQQLLNKQWHGTESRNLAGHP